MKINIIGDIAGRFDELMDLIAKMPEADLILSVGDMNDRGPKSKQVFEWFMEQQKLGKAEAIYGNHEDMFVDYIAGEGHDKYTFLYNGGAATLQSFKDEDGEVLVDADLIEWLKQRPMYFQTDNLFVSHAPITSLKNVPADPYSRDHFFIWNRYEPSKPQSKFMIHGHNGKFRWHKWGDGSIFGACIDNSHTGVLTGMHWPTKEIFEVKFFPTAEEIRRRPIDEQRELTEEEKRQLAILES